MKYTATFDIGTTAIKGVLVSDQREIVFESSLPITTLLHGDYKEQDPEEWFAALCQITRKMFAAGFSPASVRGIIMSGQMQDFIPVDAQGMRVRNAILYSDNRACEEAEKIGRMVDSKTIRHITGNEMDGSVPAAKLLWYIKNEPENYARTFKVLCSSKDYCVARLAGTFVMDVTAGATFGLMDIREKKWNSFLLTALNIQRDLLADIYYCHQQVGEITPQSSENTGFQVGTKVYAGTGDAGASTLASGISSKGEYSIYLGTSGWVATISDNILDQQDIFNLAAIPMDTYIQVVPFLNAGIVHKWISELLLPENCPKNKYEYMDDLLQKSKPGSSGLLFLPYLSGERFPVLDAKVKGCFIGLDNLSQKTDMARACLEGVAFSIRQGIEAISSETPLKITLVGGGAKTELWRQILADVLKEEIIVFENSEYLPSLAIASSVLIAQGVEKDYESFITCITDGGAARKYYPDPDTAAILDVQYERFCRIYPSVKNLF